MSSGSLFHRFGPAKEYATVFIRFHISHGVQKAIISLTIFVSGLRSYISIGV